MARRQQLVGSDNGVVLQVGIIGQLEDGVGVGDHILGKGAGGLGVDAVLGHAPLAPLAAAAEGDGEHGDLVAHLVALGGRLLAQLHDGAGGLVAQRCGGLGAITPMVTWCTSVAQMAA